MSVLYVLIPLALVMGGGALAAFLYALRKGQFDDLETPPWRAVLDEEETGEKKEKAEKK